VINFWSLMHFLTGVALGIIFGLRKTKFIKSLIITLILALAWEYYEILISIGESTLNIISDVVFVLLGMLIFYKIIYRYNPKEERLTHHRKMFDVWSINHFFTGAIYITVMEILNSPLWLSLISFLIVSFGWEYYERVIKVGEYKINREGDIISNLVGFFSILFVNLYLSSINQRVALIIAFILMGTIVVSFIKLKEHTNN